MVKVEGEVVVVVVGGEGEVGEVGGEMVVVVVVGYLAGGIKEWINNNGEISKIDKIEPQNFKTIYDEKKESIIIVDVRNKQEYAENSLLNSINLPLIDLERKIMNKELEFIKDKEIFIHCRGGPRGFIGQSILLKAE